MNPILFTDTYKVNHNRMYPDGTSLIYSNFTPRKSRLLHINSVVFFGMQHFIKEYLIKSFNDEFFAVPLADIIKEYKQENDIDTAHIEKLHDLGYLPILIKALPEGSLCPIGVPCFTIVNTHPDFGWLTNYLETIISCMIWQPITSATLALEYKKLLTKYATETDGNDSFVNWQIHDFSMRGMSSLESAIISGMGHMAVGITGSDNIPAIYQAKKSYNATGLIGASVPATEHSVMCMGTKDDEIGTFRTLMEKFPTGLLSVVSDTWDLWKVLTEFLPVLKQEIMNRDGKLVIRPDSGDPVDIICGESILFTKDLTLENVTSLAQGKSSHRIFNKDSKHYQITVINGIVEYHETYSTPSIKGVIELLWDEFGGTINDQGYKVLDSHVGAIYGDSITLERAEQICERLKSKGFASTNIVLGVGSFTYQYNTRDTFGFAMKATYGEVNGIGQEIWKDPITDDGTKRSAKGLLRVDRVNGKYILFDQQTKEQESGGCLERIFQDGKLIKEFTFDEVRQNVMSELNSL